MSHSPRPWSVGTTSIWSGEHPHESSIASVTGDYTIEFENADDIRLIEAAPDLLETLKNLVGLAKMRGKLHEYKAAIAGAELVIAKAEGRSSD